MGLDLINSEIKLITMKHLSRLRWLEFEIQLEKVKYENALCKLKEERKLLIKSDYYSGRNYSYNPIKLTPV